MNQNNKPVMAEKGYRVTVTINKRIYEMKNGNASFYSLLCVSD